MSAPTADAADAPSPADGFGGFSLGAMQLALPMQALREVLPCGALVALPSPAACVIGGIGLRGVTVPVVDLRIALGQPVATSRFPSVVIMVHEGRLLGLLADAVSGVFRAEPGSWKRSHVGDPVAAVLQGGVHRQDTGTPVSVLSPAALAGLHQVPMVEDAEPERLTGDPAARHVDAAAAGVDASAASTAAGSTDPFAVEADIPMMLLRCGSVAFAVDALMVGAALADPDIDASSVLARGACLGTLEHDGWRVPVLDLLGLCGYGPLDATAGAQALIVKLADGAVALRVGEVLDIVRVPAGRIAPVPAFALPRPELFAGALPRSALPDAAARDRARGGTSGATSGGPGTERNQYLVIDADALRDSPEVSAMARVNTSIAGDAPAAETRASRPSARAHATRRAVVTYLLRTEMATPLEQIAEILPYPADGRFEAGGAGALLGFLVNRGRSIPVLSLAEAMDEAIGDPAGASTGVPTSRASVLVVESGGSLVGFAVAELKTIAHTSWEPSLPEADAHRGSLVRGGRRRLALVGEDDDERMLPLLNLREIAARLHRIVPK